MKKITGVFKYDVFPGMVVHDITGWDEDGNCKIGGGFGLKASALIAIFPKKQGEAIDRMLSDIKQKYRKKTEELRKELLVSLYDKFPSIKQESE